MWDATSTTAALTTAYGDIGTILAVAVAAVVGALVALLGLGFGIRKARHYVTGRKF